MDNKFAFLIVGSCVGLLFGLITYFIKGYFEDRKEKTLENKKEIEDVKKKTELFQEKIQDIKSEISDRDGKIEIEFLKLNTKFDQTVETMKQYQHEISKLDGRINEHFNLVSAHISTIAHMSKQIDALFKIIEGHTGPRRLSDGG